MRNPLSSGLRGLYVAHALNGLMFGSWYPYIKPFTATLDLEPWQIGVALAGIPAGLVVGFVIAYPLMARFGSTVPLIIGLLVYCAGLALPGWGSTEWEIAVLLAIPAIGNGIFDPAVGLATNEFGVAMNRQLQGRAGGFFSLAQVAAAAFAPIAVSLEVPAGWYLSGVAAVGVAAATVACWHIWHAPLRLPAEPAEAEPAEVEPARTRPRHAWPTRPEPTAAERARTQRRTRIRFTLLAVFAVCGYATEGIWNDWHGVWLSSPNVGASVEVASLGFLVFQLAAVAARFNFERIHDVTGWWVAPGHAALACVGAALVAGALSPVMGLVGAVLLGFGTGPIVPLALEVAGTRQRLVFLVQSTGYMALLGLPASLGFLISSVGFRLALLVIPVATVLMLLTSVAVRADGGRHSGKVGRRRRPA